MLNHDTNLSISPFPIATPANDALHVWPWDLASASGDASRVSNVAETDASFGDAISYILTDCFVSLGQGVKDEKTIDQAAIVWLHNRYRAKFLRTMKIFGNTWLRDRLRVKGVSRMLGERAVSYAGDKPTIDLASIMEASAAVEKYCRLHAARRHRSVVGEPGAGDAPVRHAGYWCEPG